jgi:group I intron endonuclease
MVEYIIYKITNPIGQIYVGQTRNYTARINAYNKMQCKGQKLIYCSLKRYGIENHNFEILSKTNTNNLDELEIFFIEKEGSYYYNNKKIGLNLTLGGTSKKGYITSNKTKNKISKGNKGKKRLIRRIVSEETKLKMSNVRKDKISKGIIKINKKVILQYSLEGSLIKEWGSMLEVCKFIGITPSTLTGSLLYNKYYKKLDFLFAYKEPIELKEPEYKNKIIIEGLDINTNEIVNKRISISELSKKLQLSYSTTFRRIKTGGVVEGGILYKSKTKL